MNLGLEGGDLESFEVVAHNDGVMVGCLLCGVQDWQAGARPLLDLVRAAQAHARACSQ